MDWLYLFAVLTVIYFVVCFVLIVIGDCDILLQLTVKFGNKPGVLKKKVVWITGASSGIGEHLAYELAKAGCRLVLSARREAELERVKKECLMRGTTKEEDILVLPLDVVKFDTHKSAFETVCKKFSQVDILINNAARAQIAAWEKTELAVDRELLELNVLGVLSLTKVVLPSMLERRGGHIVNMSSATGKMGTPTAGSYTGTKHAIMGWFDSLRIEVASRGIYVTNICPGPVFSNLRSQSFTEVAGEVWAGSDHPASKFSYMSTARCAELCSIAVANKMDEVWISMNPVLLLYYLHQYFPNLHRFILKKMGPMLIKAVRD